MWLYSKKLQYPVDIKKKDIQMAKYIVTQFGGANGELGASLRYLTQRYTMPDNKGKALLSDIGTEELAHMEIISAMLYQLLEGATVDEMKAAGLSSHYTEHGISLYPVNADGVPFDVNYFAVTGDPVADLAEDMAAEQKARTTYEHLMNLSDDPDVIAPLSFLRQREIVHYQRFKELYDEYVEKYYQPDIKEC
jgi:spore coat protein JC